MYETKCCPECGTTQIIFSVGFKLDDTINDIINRRQTKKDYKNCWCIKCDWFGEPNKLMPILQYQRKLKLNKLNSDEEKT